jgi:hypothetical protein
MDRPVKVVYLLALLLAFRELWRLVDNPSPVWAGVFVAVALVLLWPLSRWRLGGWWRLPIGFVVGVLAEVVWRDGLRSATSVLPAWFDAVLFVVSIGFVGWRLSTYLRRTTA